MSLHCDHADWFLFDMNCDRKAFPIRLKNVFYLYFYNTKHTSKITLHFITCIYHPKQVLHCSSFAGGGGGGWGEIAGVDLFSTHRCVVNALISSIGMFVSPRLSQYTLAAIWPPWQVHTPGQYRRLDSGVVSGGGGGGGWDGWDTLLTPPAAPWWSGTSCRACSDRTHRNTPSSTRMVFTLRSNPRAPRDAMTTTIVYIILMGGVSPAML